LGVSQGKAGDAIGAGKLTMKNMAVGSKVKAEHEIHMMIELHRITHDRYLNRADIRGLNTSIKFAACTQSESSKNVMLNCNLS